MADPKRIGLLIGPSAVPALILGVLAAIVAFAHRDQFNS